jgi:single-stranded-DNA-specific exonuclease
VWWLLTHSASEAEALAEWLDDLNTRRQEIGESVFREAMECIVRGSGDDKLAIVAAGEGWHQGVLGIVAARLADAFHRPAFVLSIQDGIANGSGRSIPAFDMHAGLSRCADILKRYGGHKQAAGLSLAADSIGTFHEAISRVVKETLSEDELIPVLRIDAQLMMCEISSVILEEIERLAPFGYGNEEPIFGSKGLEVGRPRLVGGRHLKMHLRQNGRCFDSIGFDMGDMLTQCQDGYSVDVAFLPVMHDWNGIRSIQLNLKAVRTAGDCL